MNNVALCISVALGASLASACWAQDEPATESPPARDEAASPAPQPTADEAIEELEQLRRRREPRPIEPTPAGPAASSQPTGTSPAAAGGAGSRYREGEPILGRRGRMVRTDHGVTRWMLTFDADSSGLLDPPLYLLPCRELEQMEAAIARREDDAEFLVTGEVFIYHGQAYFLPRIARPAVDRGNLRH
jgi:hypothetical protein